MTSTNQPSALTLKIREELQKTDHSGQGWNQLWANGATPWNLGKSAPPLKELFEKKIISLSPNTKAIVPGCGEGLDVIWLAEQPNISKVVGLEISELAVQKIEKNADEKLRSSSDHRAKVHVILEDFFKFSPAVSDKYGLVFDYTFFCAIKPSLRLKWAEKMAEIVQPNGLLVTMIFPIGDFEEGPPFAVNEQIYHQLLHDKFELIYGPVESAVSVESRRGREKVAVWQRRN